MPVVLAIGTTHPLNIAGVGLDARIAAPLGVRVVTIVAGVSAQSANAVLARSAVDSALIAAQFEALRDAPIDAIHIGALVDAQSVRAIVRGLESFAPTPVVCDPVIAASSGERLADDATIEALRDSLFARCTLVTPNLEEAALLLGRAGLDTLTDANAMEAAAHELRAIGAQTVLIKGGHLEGDTTDVLVDKTGARRLTARRIDATLRGTGDLLACAIAARLAHGDGLLESVEAARAFVRGCLTSAVAFAGARTIA